MQPASRSMRPTFRRRPTRKSGAIGTTSFRYRTGGWDYVQHVTGHGIEAAVASSRVREAIVAMAYECDDPGEVLRRVNAMVCHRGLPYVTAAYGTIDIDSLDVRYSLAGHPPPVVAHRTGNATFAQVGGLPLGVIPATMYAGARSASRHSARAIHRRRDRVQTGRHRGRESTPSGRYSRGTARSAKPARDLLVSVFGNRPARDDVALLVVKFLGEPRVSYLPDGRRWSFDVSDYEAASDLRHRVMNALRADERLSGDYAAVELILGELLGNVARHTPGAIVVDFQISAGNAFLTVSDEGPGIGDVSSCLPEDVLSENGRGMFLIGALARGLTVRSSQGRQLHAHPLAARRRRFPTNARLLNGWMSA